MSPPEDNVAVELARLQGSVQTMLGELGRRVGELETRGRGAAGRFSQVTSVCVSLAAFAFVVLDRVQWEG